MITIATMVRDFEGEFDQIQHNAIRSWRGITDDVILVGDREKWAKEVAEGLGCRLIPCQRNAEGVKLVNDVIRVVQAEAKYDTVLFTGAETIYWGSHFHFVEMAMRELGTWLVIGQRRDLIGPIGTFRPVQLWYDKLVGTGKLHPGYCIEYFLFRGDPWGELPEFAAGRPGYDNCLVWKALDNGIVVADATGVVWAGHQEHGQRHRSGTLADRNRKTMREECGYSEVRHATHVIKVENGLGKLYEK
jgi:hypothetical protein